MQGRYLVSIMGYIRWRSAIRTLLLMLVCCLVLTSCVTAPVSRSDPKYQFIVTKDYYVSITPIHTKNYYYAFRLIVKNHTDEELAVDWNKTEYIFEEESNGGFMFDGIEYKDREERKPRGIVPPNDIFIKTIWPNALVEKNKDWSHQPMDDGRHGIEITIIGNNKVYKEKLMLSISVDQP